MPRILSVFFVFVEAAGQDSTACVATLLGSETIPTTAALLHTQGSVGRGELTYCQQGSRRMSELAMLTALKELTEQKSPNHSNKQRALVGHRLQAVGTVTKSTVPINAKVFFFLDVWNHRHPGIRDLFLQRSVLCGNILVDSKQCAVA